ncbi:Toll-Interleukin-Resistance domain family protein, partial [Prunus dulcis]
MRPTSESAEWIFLATNLGLEMLSAACDQASSQGRPHFALFGMLLAIAAVFISIGELIYRGKRERVEFRSRLSNKRMNANIEQQEQEQLWQRQLGEPQEQERLLQRMNANTSRRDGNFKK